MEKLDEDYGSILNDMNEFFDNAREDDDKPVNVVKQNSIQNDAVQTLYKKLEEDHGMNLEELKPILECMDNTLVLSGAGAGKTTALILKIIKDLISGETLKVVNVDTIHGRTVVQVQGKILVCTFLSTGADELRKAFFEWCQKLGIVGIDSSAIQFRTIHAEVRNALIDMGVTVNILEDSTSLIRSVMQKYDIRSVNSVSRNITVDEIKDIESIIAYARNRLDDKRYQQPLMRDYKLNTILLDAIINDFKLMRLATGKVDFEDMQEMLLEALKMNEKVREFIKNRYDYVYVDEFQDTSQLQYELLKYYFAGAKRVVVYGDDDQCLVEGTLVQTSKGVKPIEEVKEGDRVLTGIGHSKVGYFVVDKVSRKRVNEDIVVMQTKSGKELRGTDNHLVFAREHKNKEDALDFTMFDSEQISGEGVYKSKFGLRTSSDIDGLMTAVKELRSIYESESINKDIDFYARLTNEKYEFMLLGNVKEGMLVPVVQDDGIVVEDEVVNVVRENYNGYVYDISIPTTRNFSANDILVHNCIYSWRGSDSDIIGKRFEKDVDPTILKLTTNYRCKSNILDFVKPSIEKNSQRHPKQLRSFKEGGSVRVVKDADVNKLIQFVKEDITEKRSVGVLARVNADLLVPAIILELDGNVDFVISKAVGMNNRLARQIFGVMDLVTKRFTQDFENHLRLFVPRYVWYEAKNLYDTLYKNSKVNLYNIPMDDLEHSTPNLAPFIRGLRHVYKTQGGVGAYIFILEKLKADAFKGDSLYAKRARDLINFVIKIILEHDKVKDLDIGAIDSLFNQVLPDKLMNRAKYKNNAQVKLTTVHEAKGKEWDSVYIWNDVDGVFPNQVGGRDITEDEYEEERRVHYIACTRAKDLLTIFTVTNKESPFLEECDFDNTNVKMTEKEQLTDKKHVFKKAIPTKVKPALYELISSYVTDMTSYSLSDPRVVNIEMVLANYELFEVEEKFKERYNALATMQNITSYEDITQELDDLFSDLADEVYTKM